MTDFYAPDVLARSVAEAKNWNDLMRRLGLKTTGGRRRVLQAKVAEYGIDTGHFQQERQRKYTDEAIAVAVRCCTTLREVAVQLGAVPATGTLSHLSHRITAAGIDVAHFQGSGRAVTELPFTTEELRAAATQTDSVRGVARALGIPDDGRTRAALGALLRRRNVDMSHFRNARREVLEHALRAVVPTATSFADVMRALDLEVNDTNHRRIQRKALQLDLDTSHFTRRARRVTKVHEPRRTAHRVLVVREEGSPRVNRAQLHRALQEIGVPYCCTVCDNPGEWRGQVITLQIDHIDGNWLDNRPENLRYLCPNCHALTETWCRKRKKHPTTS
ncbi:HNH endonuclease [Streptomyces sp. NPDC048442]|uniref:HNH endonuclease signature motif containing protein n=1 Tax=Streptomyces sp. NPDC048442 TaxID=3154823 RepID=UPI00341D7C2A